MNLRAVRLFVWIASGVLCFSLPIRSAASKIRIGYSAITTTQAPLWAAEDRDFSEIRLETELIYLAMGRRSRWRWSRSRFNSAGSTWRRRSMRARRRKLRGDRVLYDYYYFQILASCAATSDGLKTRSSPRAAQLASSTASAMRSATSV
jgi:hypothetical protein